MVQKSKKLRIKPEASGAPKRRGRPRAYQPEIALAKALDLYLSGEAGPRGCFTVMTAASEAVSDPEIRAMVLDGFTELDKAFAACFRLARERHELPETSDPVVLAQLASATL